MGKFSRDKGARFERLVAKKWTELFGGDNKRGCQHMGGFDSPDVILEIKGISVECKHVEKLNMYSAMQQSIDDSGDNIPIVISKKNHKPILVTLQLEDLPELVKKLQE